MVVPNESNLNSLVETLVAALRLLKVLLSMMWHYVDVAAGEDVVVIYGDLPSKKPPLGHHLERSRWTLLD